jgi:hypothetical protein
MFLEHRMQETKLLGSWNIEYRKRSFWFYFERSSMPQLFLLFADLVSEFYSVPGNRNAHNLSLFLLGILFGTQRMFLERLIQETKLLGLFREKRYSMFLEHRMQETKLLSLFRGLIAFPRVS